MGKIFLNVLKEVEKIKETDPERYKEIMESKTDADFEFDDYIRSMPTGIWAVDRVNYASDENGNIIYDPLFSHLEKAMLEELEDKNIEE